MFLPFPSRNQGLWAGLGGESRGWLQGAADPVCLWPCGFMAACVYGAAGSPSITPSTNTHTPPPGTPPRPPACCPPPPQAVAYPGPACNLVHVPFLTGACVFTVKWSEQFKVTEIMVPQLQGRLGEWGQAGRAGRGGGASGGGWGGQAGWMGGRDGRGGVGRRGGWGRGGAGRLGGWGGGVGGRGEWGRAGGFRVGGWAGRGGRGG